MCYMTMKLRDWLVAGGVGFIIGAKITNAWMNARLSSDSDDTVDDDAFGWGGEDVPRQRRDQGVCVECGLAPVRQLW